MLLTLHPAAAAQRPACAALLPGADPAAWLRELSSWEVPAAQLRCYLVPESIRSVRPAGLFVIVENGTVPAGVLAPYGVEAGRLYLPTHARLWPATTPAELDAALLWPRQLLHPGIGLVGFEATDELHLADLLDLPPPRPTDWARALPGPPPPAPLRRIVVPAPSATEVVQQLQADLAPAPLTELPGLAAARPTATQNLLKELRRRLTQLGLGTVRALRAWGTSIRNSSPRVSAGTLWTVLKVAALVLLAAVLLGVLVSVLQGGQGYGSLGVLFFVLIRLLTKLVPGNNTTAWPAREASRRARPPRPAPAPPGWLHRAEQRLGARLADLQKQRDAELERLLQLFADNPAEALRYAIPLSSPYLNRGTAPPSGQLGRRTLGFDLGRLGGGQRVDAWDLGHYQADLRRQYLAAAAQETAAGRHQQAAYIHAHLLGDFRAAAQALEQGGLFREAAALWRDHLRNEPAAAQCLERGGLLQEAAELYAKLGQLEKAGDLYRQLSQPAVAARCYEQAVTTLLASHDHPAAARLLATKLADQPRAGQVLLQGWASHRQPEPCLRQYFDLTQASAATSNDLPAQVGEVFRHHTPPGRGGALLRVLAQVAEQYPSSEVLAAARAVAYEVLATEPSAANLQLLPRFLPDDPLLAGDCSRYASRQPRPAPPATPTQGPNLDNTIEWLAATSYRQQWLAVGRRDNRLHLARSNWYGQVEYYSWVAEVPTGVQILLVADEQHGSRVLLQPSLTLFLEPKRLPKNKHFAEELTVQSPTWLPGWPARLTQLLDNSVVAARLLGDTIKLQRYSATGKASPPVLHTVARQEPPFKGYETAYPGVLLHYAEGFYTYWDTELGWFKEGEATFYPLGESVFDLVRSPYAATLLLAASTENAIFFWKPTGPGEQGVPRRFELPDHYVSGLALCFISTSYLVGVFQKQAFLFQYSPNELRLVRTIQTEHWLVAALPTSQRQQFALLETSGRLTRHSITD